METSGEVGCNQAIGLVEAVCENAGRKTLRSFFSLRRFFP